MNHIAFRIPDSDGEAVICVAGCVVLVVFYIANPELEMHRLSWPIDRPVGNSEGLRLVVLVIIVVLHPY